MPNNVVPLHLKQTFPPLIWIFAEQSQDEPYNLKVLNDFPELDFLWSRLSV